MKTLHKSFVALYGVLERCYVPRYPNTTENEHCLLTGVVNVTYSEPRVELDDLRERVEEMHGVLCKVAGVPLRELHVWSDAGPKEKVLAGVAECIAWTAPEPHVELEVPTEVAA